MLFFSVLTTFIPTPPTSLSPPISAFFTTQYNMAKHRGCYILLPSSPAPPTSLEILLAEGTESIQFIGLAVTSRHRLGKELFLGCSLPPPASHGGKSPMLDWMQKQFLDLTTLPHLAFILLVAPQARNLEGDLVRRACCLGTDYPCRSSPCENHPTSPTSLVTQLTYLRINKTYCSFLTDIYLKPFGRGPIKPQDCIMAV